jgi:hypothetical protein
MLPIKIWMSFMTRISKQGKLRRISYRRPRPPSPKTGPKQDQILNGFRFHENAISTEAAANRFIPKIS